MDDDPQRDEAIRRAEAAIRAAESRAADDPARPAYHFHARAHWMNDPNGPIFHKGWYHLFYQANPFGELTWGENAAMYWGHARSRDLVHWEHLPPSVWPSRESGEEHCWSGGCVIRDDGRPMVFYTSIGPKHQPKDSAEQWAALGDGDFLKWRKHANNPIVPDPMRSGVRILEWRDPFVFREGKHWYMVTGGHREGCRGCISLFRSDDLDRWEFVGIPIEGEEENWECPALFRLGDRWALIYSPHAQPKYYTGCMDFERCRFKPDVKGQFDFGPFIGFYAPTAMPDPKGRMILWGWMYSANKNRGWNGCLALPRVLSLLPDGRLGQEPTPEFETLRRDEQSGRGMRLENTVRRYDVEGGGFEARVKIRAVDAKKSGIRLCEKDGRTAAAIDCAADGVVVSGDRIPAGELGGVTPLDLRIFVDRSLLEVYVNGRASAMRWMDSHRIERLEIYAEKGSADIASMQVWRMESACLYGKGNGSE